MLRYAILLFAAVMLAPGAGHAADDPVKTVGDFVKLCASPAHKKACKGEVVTERATVWIMKGLNPNDKSCDVPSDVDFDNGAAQIAAWLRRHKELYGETLHKGLQTAMRTLWNCRETLAWGMTRQGAPDTVDRFLAFCDVAANRKKCDSEIEGVGIDITVVPSMGPKVIMPGHCPMPGNMPLDRIRHKITAWLTANPQPESEDTALAIAKANDALWPCPPQRRGQ